MKWFNAISEKNNGHEGILEVIQKIQQAQISPDLICLFITSDHTPIIADLVQTLQEAYQTACIVGASGSGVIGEHKEIENAPCISVIAAELPDVALKAISFTREQLRVMGHHEWRSLIDLEEEQQPCFIVLCDPYGFDPAHIIRHLNRAYANAPMVGGVSSGGKNAGENTLICGDRILNEGAVVLGLYGDIQMTPLLSQGCRPIGPIMKVTSLKRNMIVSLDNTPVVEKLQKTIDDMPKHIANHFRNNPMIGISESKEKTAPASGDFKIRSILGVSQNFSGMAIGGYVEDGDWVQFHVRDPKSASKMLHRTLRKHISLGIKPKGTLIFSCIGRGEKFFQQPNHDSSAYQSAFPSSQSGGLFCNGEIGASKSTVQVHSYSCSIAMFAKKMWS